MRTRALSLGALALVLGLDACGGDPPKPPPQSLALGDGFTGKVLDGDRLVIASSDGRVLLDGLSPGAVSGDAPPLVGFALREETTTYETSFGAFKPTVTPSGPWRVAHALHGSAKDLALEDADGKAFAHLAFSTPEPGHLVVSVTAPGPAFTDLSRSRRLSWGFACDADDHFAGFGAQSWDADHRGQTLSTFVSEGGIGKSTTDDYSGLWELVGQRHSSQAPIPEYLSRRGYLLVAKTDRSAKFALCSEKETTARFEVDLPVEIHVFDGPKPAEAIARATQTFGRPRMPPLAVFAPWMDAVFGSDNVRRVAKKVRDNQIPMGVMWTEDWRGGEWSGDNYALKEEWEVDRTLYPDFEKVASDLHASGFDFLVYFNPFVYQESKAWAETQPNGWLVKDASGADDVFQGAKFTNTGLVDLDDADARAWAIGKMRGAIALGADGWMLDYGEWLPTDAVTSSGPAYDEHNRYPVLWQTVGREAIDGVNDGIERFYFARSGWLGTPALADVFWAGDQRTTMDPDDGMPTVIPMGIGLGVAGISTYTSDIGGYQSGTNPGSTQEVYWRWTELGAWSPVMRTHHGSKPNLNWSWEKDAETLAHFKRYATLHMALVPTLAGLARVASDTGLPIWRGMALAFPDDAAVWPITDQVMMGDGILIAPVEVPGVTSRNVYLPKGRWFPWNGGAPQSGPQTLTVDAPLGEIPVFARAGTVVPMYPDGVMTLAYGSAATPDASSVGDDRVVRAFLGDAGSFTEAGGLSYALEALGPTADGALTATFTPTSGSPIAVAACAAVPVAPCQEEVSGESIIHVVGPGAVVLAGSGGDVARFTATGGDAARKLVIRVAH